MKNRVVVEIILTAVFIAIIIVQGVSYRSKLKINEQRSISGSEFSLEKEAFYKSVIKNNIRDASRSISLDPNIKFIGEAGGRLNPFAKYETANRILLYVYSLSNCEVCISHEVINLEKLRLKNDSLPVLIVALTSDDRTLVIQRQAYDTKIPIVGVDSPLLSQNILSSEEKPYYFLLDRSMKASNLFTPLKEDDNFTEYYYSLIASKIYNTSHLQK